jgi:hypothetical protein
MNARFLPSFIVVIFLLITAYVTLANAPPPIKWLGITEIAAGRGERGPWRQNDSRYDYVDDPTVAIDDKGEIAVAWVDQAKKDVFFQRFSKDGVKQGLSVNVSKNPATFSWLPRVASAPDNPQKIYILWQEIIFSGGSHGGDILFARSEDGGTTFSKPLNISSSIGGDGKGRINKDVWSNGSLDLATDSNGMVYAAWTEYEGRLWFCRSSDGGKTFARLQHIAGDQARPARGPSLALGRDNTVYLAWTVGDDNAADIRIAKSGDGGSTFTEPVIVAKSPGYSDAPKIALDPAGVLHLVYAESIGGPFERYRIFYTRSSDGARTFEAPLDSSRTPPNAVTGVGYPALAIDGQGNLYVMWELYPDPKEDPRGLVLTISRDGGRSFTLPAAVPGSSDPGGGTNGSHQGLLMKKLAANRAGAIVIANSSLEQDERSRVWLMRGQIAR